MSSYNTSRWFLIPLFVLFLFRIELGYAQGVENLTAIENYELGSTALEDLNTELAIEYFQSALAINPNYFNALYQLAYSYWLLGEYTQSQQIAQQAQRLSYQNVELSVLQARIATAIGEYDEARRRYRNILTRYPRNIDAQFGLAELTVAQGRFREAIQAFESILTFDRDNYLVYLSLATLYEWEGELAQSEEAIERALDLRPLHFYTQYSAGRHYLNRNLLSNALYHAEIAAELAPNNPESIGLLVEIALRQRDTATALTLAEQLVELEPRNINHWYLRGVVLAEIQDYAGALSSFDRALLIRRDAELPRIAAEHILRSHSGFPDGQRQKFAQYRFARGRQFQERNLLEQALDEYRRGLQVNPLSLEGREEFADIQLQLGYQAKYLQELEVLTELGLSNRDINDRIETFRSLLSNSVAIQWGVDQFTIPGARINLQVIIDSTRSASVYQESLSYIGEWLLDLLRVQENVALYDTLALVQTSSEAHRLARTADSDYYLYTSIEEFNNSILLQIELKSSRTGITIRNYRAIYRGTDRIQRATRYLVSRITADLPIRAQLIDRRNNRGLINIGSSQGAQEGDTLVVVAQGALAVALEEPRLVFENDRIAGRCQIIRTDDLVSEVMLMRTSLFDTFSIGDEVIFLRHAQTPIQPDETPNPLYERLRLIR